MSSRSAFLSMPDIPLTPLADIRNVGQSSTMIAAILLLAVNALFRVAIWPTLTLLVLCMKHLAAELQRS